MSKLIDRLSQVSLAAPRPMGFKTVQEVSEKPRMLLVASLEQSDVGHAADYMAGADAGLLRISGSGSGVEDWQRVLPSVPDIPWGAWLTDIGRGDTGPVSTEAFDYVVFPAASTSLAVLQDGEGGRVLEVDESLHEGMLRAVDELPVGAVLIGGEPDPHLTWRHLILFQSFADLLTKPLLVAIPSGVTVSELQALWAAGVNGVIMRVGGEQPPGRLAELSRAITGLTFPPQRKRSRLTALVSYGDSKVDTVTEGPDEDEE